MNISTEDTHHVFQNLRQGTVPSRGIEAFAVGIDGPRAEIRRLLRLAGHRDGAFKFLRGDYGCGKTFMAHLAMHDALQEGFVTSFVVVSDNDLHFHRFDELYRKVIQGLATPLCERGALGPIIDRWIAAVEDSLLESGEDEQAPGFDQLVVDKLGQDLRARTQGRVPHEMSRALAALFEARQRSDFDTANSLLAWLSGSTNVGHRAVKDAGLKGQIESDQALSYLRGIVEIIRAAGYKGLTIVVDELETVMRQRGDTRSKTLNGLRQIIDLAPDLAGLLWVMTGTPLFFDDRAKGIASLQPLHDRVKLESIGGRTSLRGAQLVLTPFDEDRLREVARKLRELYPAEDRERFLLRIPPALLDRLVEEFTTGFGGRLTSIPRPFLKRLVHLFDLVDEDPTYDPRVDLHLGDLDLNDRERAILRGDDEEELFVDG